MESLTKPIKLSEIAYPVYKLKTTPPIISGGVVYYETEYEVDGNIKTLSKVVDNKNQLGNTLGRRRLQLKTKTQVELYKLKYPIYSLAGLIKQAGSKTWFIDTQGKVFNHKKTTSAKLFAKRITNVFSATNELGYIIEVEGIFTRFKSIVKPIVPYAGILKFGSGYLLYDFYKESFKPTRRMI